MGVGDTCYCLISIRSQLSLRSVACDVSASKVSAPLLGLPVSVMARIFLCRCGLPTNQVPPAQAFFATSIAFAFSITALKLSVLFFYVRIFPQRQFRIICILVGIVCIAWFIAYILLFFFTCIPFAYYWDKSIPGGHCMNENHIGYYGTTPPDILTNIVLLVLPIPYLWKLQMRKAKKIAITAIFVLGTLYVYLLIGYVPKLTIRL